MKLGKGSLFYKTLLAIIISSVLPALLMSARLLTLNYSMLKAGGTDWTLSEGAVQQITASLTAETVSYLVYISVISGLIAIFTAGSLIGPIRRFQQSIERFRTHSLDQQLDFRSEQPSLASSQKGQQAISQKLDDGSAKNSFGYLEEVQRFSKDEIGSLAVSFNDMAYRIQMLLSTLEQRVTERTRRLELVADLSERLGLLLNMEDLSSELVQQIKDKFNYYHVHIYLIDEQHRNLIVAAGTGEAGAKMKAQGHSISLDASTSLVAKAARTKEIVRVDNVREADDWLPNPLLPDTYSEMAVPIVLEGQVVGILDVQEDKINGLDESDASLLRSLANQVAVAIRNARLFNEVEAALAEARVVQEQYIEQTWNKMKRIEKGMEHLHVRDPAAPLLPETAMAEAKQLALSHNNPTVVALNADNLDVLLQNPNLDGVTPPELSKRIKSIVAPVILGGNTIGALQMHRSDADDGSEPLLWTDEDLAIVEAVLDQVAQSAENLRLFEETRQHAGREQTIRQITENMRAATSLEELVEIAAKELGQHFSAEYAMVELGDDT